MILSARTYWYEYFWIEHINFKSHKKKLLRTLPLRNTCTGHALCGSKPWKFSCSKTSSLVLCEYCTDACMCAACIHQPTRYLLLVLLFYFWYWGSSFCVWTRTTWKWNTVDRQIICATFILSVFRYRFNFTFPLLEERSRFDAEKTQNEVLLRSFVSFASYFHSRITDSILQPSPHVLHNWKPVHIVAACPHGCCYVLPIAQAVGAVDRDSNISRMVFRRESSSCMRCGSPVLSVEVVAIKLWSTTTIMVESSRLR